MDGPTMIVAMTALLVSGWVLNSIIGLFRRKSDAKHSPAELGNAEMDARIAHIEQAVDAIAVEIERISEGQRFTTRLLSERPAAQLPASNPSVKS